jgi:zinc protease
MVRVLSEGSVYTSPEQNLKRARADVAGLTADTVNAALRASFQGGGPLIYLSSPNPVEGGEEAVAREFASAEVLVLEGGPALEQPIWPYAEFGRAGSIAERRTVPEIDTTLVRFANGVRLNVKPTRFSAGEIAVLVSVGDGRLELPKDHPSAIWAAITGALVNGGLQGIDPPAMQRALSGKIFKVGFALGDAGFIFLGDTRPADLDTQLQVLAAYVKAPAFRPQAFAQARRGLLAQIQQVNSAPLGLFSVSLPGLLHSNDPRWMFPKPADVEATQPEELKTLLSNALAWGPIEVTIVGDAEVERAIQAVGATFGALGPRNSQPLSAAKSEAPFPAGGAEPVILTHQGRADQGLAAVAWPTTDMLADSKVFPVLQVLCDVVQAQLTEQLRSAAGVSYTTQCAANSSQILPGYGFLVASADIQPDRASLFFDTSAKIAADLRAHAVAADELAREQRPEIEKLKHALQTNQFWISFLSRAQRDPRRLENLPKMLPELESVTAADVQRAAKTYLVEDKAWKLVVKKAAAP